MTGRSPATRVLVVDDQPLLRSSLALLVGAAPDLTVVGEAATGREAVRVATKLLPDVVLMDIRMPDGDGIEATRAIAAAPELAGTAVLVLSMFDLDQYVFGALQAGAAGFLLKDAEPEALLDAIRRTHHDESLFAPAILTRLVEHYVTRPPRPATGHLDLLTAREREVLTAIGRGRSNDEIAADLWISVKTVKTHVGNLLAKLHARDRGQLVIHAYESGLV